MLVLDILYFCDVNIYVWIMRNISNKLLLLSYAYKFPSLWYFGKTAVIHERL